MGFVDETLKPYGVIASAPDNTMTREGFRNRMMASTPALGGEPQQSRLIALAREFSVIQRVFTTWAGSRDNTIDCRKTFMALSFWNKQADRDGRKLSQTSGAQTISYYDKSFYGWQFNANACTRWIWDELRSLEEEFGANSAADLQVILEFAKIGRVVERILPDVNGFVEMDHIVGLIREYNTSGAHCILPAYAPATIKNGKVSAKDFALCLRDWLLEAPDFANAVSILEEVARKREPSLAAQIAHVFRKFDTSGNGTIDLAALRTVMTKIHEFPSGELEVLIECADKNQDGRVNYAEFAQWVCMVAEDEGPETVQNVTNRRRSSGTQRSS